MKAILDFMEFRTTELIIVEFHAIVIHHSKPTVISVKFWKKADVPDSTSNDILSEEEGMKKLLGKISVSNLNLLFVLTFNFFNFII